MNRKITRRALGRKCVSPTTASCAIPEACTALASPNIPNPPADVLSISRRDTGGCAVLMDFTIRTPVSLLLHQSRNNISFEASSPCVY